MGKMPIPDDWDGLTWNQWYVCWPDSEQWRGVLQGQVSAPSLGYFWDGATGVIKDAQDIGFDINTENLPLIGAFMKCGDDIDRLIAAIGALSTGASSAACGCQGGTAQGTTSGTEGGVAPEGFVDPPNPPGSPEYDERKCKVANMSWENIRDMFTAWQQNGIGDFIGQGILSAAAFIIVTTIISTVLGELTTPFPLLDGLVGGVIGFIASVAIAIAVDNFSLTGLITILTDNGQDFVCALYTSTTGDDAIDRFVQAAIDNAATTSQQNVLRATLWVDYLNALFFSPEDDPGLEAALSAYTPPFACTGCCPDWFIEWGIPEPLDQWRTDAPAGAWNIRHIAIKAHSIDGAIWCGPKVNLTPTNLVGWTVTIHPGDDFVVYDDDLSTVLYTSKTTIWPAGQCGRYFVIRSQTEATVTLDAVSTC